MVNLLDLGKMCGLGNVPLEHNFGPCMISVIRLTVQLPRYGMVIHLGCHSDVVLIREDSLWNQLLEVVKQERLSDNPDKPIWRLEPKGAYTVKSFYHQINFGGVVSTTRMSLWKVICPQKIHVFLWLCVHNKVLTRDNLEKRRPVENTSCLFCSCKETVQHLLFDCIVARQVWGFLMETLNIKDILGFDDVVVLWKDPKKNCVLNMIIAASLWSVWKLRNEICFQGRIWRNFNCILAKLGVHLDEWKILLSGAQAELLRGFIRQLDQRHGDLLRIAWR
ncbi:hypothetical protein D1007_43931 [Hordeum vulgare]|nr:hypothetical protein D1007_43931 [Hordeum vulgare]